MEFSIAQRASAIDASGIRKIFDLAARMENPVNLSIGQPDFDIPADIMQSGIDAIQAGFNRYTQTQGTAELNEGIRSFLQKRYSFSPEATIVTSGVSGALHLLMLALVEKGDTVAFADPYFVMYKHLVNLSEGTPVIIDTYPDFTVSAERVAACITPKTKILILNSPANPTGRVIPDTELKQIAEICRKNNTLVISDEIYSSFSYDAPFTSIATYYPEGTVLVDGFSKSVSMTGWRVGFAAGPAAIIEQMTKLQQYTFVCAPSFAQKAALKALNSEHTFLDEYKKRRDFIYKGLLDAGYEVVCPEGAFYIFPKCPESESSFIEKAIQNNLLVIPGSVFSEQSGYFRISFASPIPVLEKGLEILRRIKNQ